MGYRDEKDGLRAQVKELQEQLARADLRIERLTGNAAPQPSGEVIERSRLLDAPSRVVLERDLDFEIGEEGFEAIAALLRPKLGAVAQVGRTLTANGFSLACADGATKVRMVGDYRNIARGAVSASVLLGAFAAFGTFGIAHDFVNRSLAEVNILWMAPLFIAVVFAFVRQLSKRSAHTKAKEQRATLEAVVEVALRCAKKRPAANKARVEVSPSVSEEGAAETEAAAEAEAAEADAESIAERERIAAREP